MRSIEVDRNREYLGHVLVVLMDLEAQTLSELRSFYALSICIGFGSRFIKIIDFLTEERLVE